jgi:hypothetical protein
LYFAVISATLSAQESLVFNNGHILFLDAKTHTPVLLTRDSILYSGYHFERKSISVTQDFKALDIHNPYKCNIKQKTFLVADGGGPVLEFRNNGFYRLDNSFPQRNQYFAAPFVYDNNIYLFGGYGLFTHKNLITKYNFKIGEWTEEQISIGPRPVERFKSYSIVLGDYLYVFGGMKKNPRKVQEHIRVQDHTVWQLHLPTMQWSKKGEYDPSYFGNEYYVSFQAEGKLYLLYEKIYEIDLQNNTIKRYAFREWKGIKDIIYDSVTKKITYTYKLTNSGAYKVLNEPLSSFLGNLESENEFIESNPPFFAIALIALFFLLIIWVVIKTMKRRDIKKKCIIYNEREKLFYFNNSEVKLNMQEKNLLTFLVENREAYIPLNQLNDLFSNGDNENFNVISKRREITQAELLFKLSTLLNMPKGDILLERKNPIDKRLKEVKIAADLFEV